MKSLYNKEEFKKAVMIKSFIALFGNITLITIFNLEMIQVDATYYSAALLSLFCFNLYTMIAFSLVLKKRVSYLLVGESKKKIIINLILMAIITTLLPMIGLFLIFSLFIDDIKNKQKRWSLGSKIPKSVGMALVASFIITLVSTNQLKHATALELSYKSLVRYQVSPSIKYVTDTMIEAYYVFDHKKNLNKLCPTEDKASCLHKKNKEVLSRYDTSSTGIILSIAAEAVSIFKQKKVKDDKKSPKEESMMNAAILLIDTNLSWMQISCNKKTLIEKSFPYGIYLATGSVEIPLIILAEKFIQNQYLDTAYIRLSALLQGIKEKKVQQRKIASLETTMDAIDKSVCLKNTRSFQELRNNLALE
jgi:hypothetical protein